MPVVIGQNASVLKTITCKDCGAVIQYKQSEVRNLWSGTDYGGGSDGADGFNCPQCNQQVHTRRW